MQTYMKPRTQQAVTALHTCRVLGHHKGLPSRTGLPRHAACQTHLGSHWRRLPSLAFISTSKVSLCKKEMQTLYWSSTGRHEKKKKSLKSFMPGMRVLKLLDCNYSRQLSDSSIHKTAVLFWKQAWKSTCLAKKSISSDKQNSFLHAN